MLWNKWFKPKSPSNNEDAQPNVKNHDFYFENGLMVMTESYHLKRGHCCGNKCRHCPYDHINVKEE